MGQDQKGPTERFCHNKSTIALTKNPIMHRRTKHIDIRFNFIRGLVEDNTITLKFCSTDQQLADIFTKPLSTQKFSYLRMRLGISSYELRGGVRVNSCNGSDVD